MKYTSMLILATLTAFLTSCSTPQTIILKDGSTILTVDEVDFDKNSGFYQYKDATGRKSQINKDLISEIKDVE